MIITLYQKLCYFMMSKEQSIMKPSILLNLKKEIEEKEVYWVMHNNKRIKDTNISNEKPKD